MKRANRATFAITLAVAVVAGLVLAVQPLGAGAATTDPDPRIAVAEANVAAYCVALVDDATTARQVNTRADLCAMWTRELADLQPAPTTTPVPTTVPPTTPPVTTVPPTTAPPTTQPPATGWPGPTSTGVPSAVLLTPYTGPCTITTATTITAKTVNCGALFVNAALTIINSKINGQVLQDYRPSPAAVTITDSEVDGGTRQGAAVSNTNVTVVRSNIHGGAASVQCGSNCVVRDSWLHGQYRPAGSDWHLDGFITNGGSNMTLTHNTLACDEMTGGCTADGFLAADFSEVTNVTFEGNLFVASPQVQYCTYGGSNRLGSSGIVYRDNVFQRGTNGKCGRYGVAIYTEGAAWTGNRWDDGSALNL